MRLTFKIVAGVFLGIIGVIVVLAIPKWRTQSRAADAQRAMELLAPEQLIARCGAPTKDEIDLTGKIRSIVYPSPTGSKESIVVNFIDDGYHKWIFANMGVSDIESGASTKLEGYAEQLQFMPCLRGK